MEKILIKESELTKLVEDIFNNVVSESLNKEILDCIDNLQNLFNKLKSNPKYTERSIRLFTISRPLVDELHKMVE